MNFRWLTCALAPKTINLIKSLHFYLPAAHAENFTVFAPALPVGSSIHLPDRKCSVHGAERGHVVFLLVFSTHIKMSLKLVKIKCTKFSMENVLRSARSSSAWIESSAVNAILTPGWDHSPKYPHRPTPFYPLKNPLTPLIVVLAACSLVDLWSCFVGWLPLPPFSQRSTHAAPPSCTSFACNSFS